MPLIDTHVHIDFYSNPLKIANMYEQNKIYTIFVTNLPELYTKHKEFFSNYKYIRLAFGFHPSLVEEYELDESNVLQKISDCKYIGEVGLDFYDETKNSILKQTEIFDFLTQPKINKGRIYTIHSKKAEDDVLKILIKNNVRNAIFHWYSGKISSLKKIIDNGYYFSVNYKMLTSKNGYNIIKHLPLERLLFETDGPFPRYEKKIITPNSLEEIYNKFEKTIPNFKEIVFTNFKHLLIAKDLELKLYDK